MSLSGGPTALTTYTYVELYCGAKKILGGLIFALQSTASGVARPGRLARGGRRICAHGKFGIHAWLQCIAIPTCSSTRTTIMGNKGRLGERTEGPAIAALQERPSM
jgi:hypothetical protein